MSRSGNGLRGCAWTCGAVSLLAVIGVVALIAAGGWYLFREGITRPEEIFLSGEETHYVYLRLRPDDEGMRRLALAVFAHVEESFFAGPATPSWLRAGRTEGWLGMLPASVEWANSTGENGAVRVRFEGNHGTARALFRVLRWGASATNEVPGAPRAVDIVGEVPGIRLPVDEGGDLVLAFIGNRLLASREDDRIERILSTSSDADSSSPSLGSQELPESTADGDGWGWTRITLAERECRVIFTLQLESEDVLSFEAVPARECESFFPAEADQATQLRIVEEVERIASAGGLTLLDRPRVRWREEGPWKLSGRLGGVVERARRAIPSVAFVPGDRGEVEPDR